MPNPQRRVRPHNAPFNALEHLESRLLLTATLPARPRKHHPRPPVVRQAPAQAPAPVTPPAGAAPTVVGRYLAYAATPFYGDAPAPDKTALLPGQTAAFANVSTYAGGIDEIILDVAGGLSFSASDFTFRVGNSADPSAWSASPAPVSVSAIAGGGVAGSTRITVQWSDGAIANQWLQIQFAPAGDTFYFGSLIGATSALQVTAADEAAVRAGPCTLLDPAAIGNPCDFNRDGKIDALDQLLSRANAGSTLAPLTIPLPIPPVSYDWHTQILNGILNVWAPNPDDFGTTYTVSAPNALFGADGIPQLESIHQGSLADCYFLAAEGSLAFSNPARIQSLVSNDATGGWAVTFQYWNSTLGVYQPMVFHTSRELSSTYQFPAGEVWSAVMEKAYAAFRSWNGSTSKNTMASLNWGYGSYALNALNDANSLTYYRMMSDAETFAALQTAL
ncbi:MAG TPA: C2 family cysteine protease, partial [Phycisphaerae bacterium]|nr:C2 family cysteine protease [Phycisphaerae bacterium]